MVIGVKFYGTPTFNMDRKNEMKKCTHIYFST